MTEVRITASHVREFCRVINSGVQLPEEVVVVATMGLAGRVYKRDELVAATYNLMSKYRRDVEYVEVEEAWTIVLP